MPLVLTHKPDSGYDDVPWERYQFPERYRKLLAASEGEWFVYYEPRRGGREVYVALAKLGRVRPDENRVDHFYAEITEYEPFTEVVPWKVNGRSLESALQNADGSTNSGQFQWAVRSLPLAEFNTIVQAGLASAYEEGAVPIPAVADGEMPIVERPVVEMLVQRKVRDRAFMATVRDAYGQTCAFTGLRVVNGGGWTEMEAAHIRPVEHNGPDTVRNGLALSRTMHALFDRGFLTLTNEFEIIESERAVLPDQLRALILKNRIARVPEEPALRPHRSFLEFHRTTVFKDRAA